jgi:hypothetical protein
MPTRTTPTSRWSTLNPRATVAERRKAHAVARVVAGEYAARGAQAVVLAGSWARGDAHRGSDLDLWVLGRGKATETLWRYPFMVCVSRTTPGLERRRFRDPRRIGGSVPGWRLALPLYDPKGLAAGLKREAVAFRWEEVAGRCDRWVASSVVEWAEEAVKLVRALAEGHLLTACVQRNLLADALGFVMAVHRRVFWDSENQFWERIGDAVGGAWQSAQRTALGAGASDPTRSCTAALALYFETARTVWPLLGDEQRSLVAHAGEIIGHSFG